MSRRVDKTLIDDVVVDRLTRGFPTRSSRRERVEATRRMVTAGMSTTQIATQMGRSAASVDRYRAELRNPSASPQPVALEATA